MEQNEIKSQILKGSIYTGIAKYYNIFCQLLVTAILARLLSPSDFGIVAIAMVVISFFDIIADAGLGPAIVQNKGMDDEDYSHVFSLSIYFALLLSVFFLLLIKPASAYYGEDALVMLLSLLTVQLFFVTVKIVPRALLLKRKRFKTLSKIGMTSITIFGFISIIVAYLGGGIISLLIIPIGNSIFSFICCLLSTNEHLRFIFKPRFSPTKKLLSFSFFQLSFNVINYFSRNFDKLLMGKFLGMSDLGYYEKSYRIMTLPLSTLTNVLSPTIQPVLSKYQDDRDILLSLYYKMTRLLIFFGALIVPFLFFSAKELILIVFGDQWVYAIPIFQILSISCIFQLADSLSGGFLQAANAPRYLFVSGFLCALLNILFLLIGLFVFGDLYRTTICVSISFSLNFIVSVIFIVKMTFRDSLANYFKLFIKPLCLLFLTALLLYSATMIKINSVIITLAIKVTLTICMALLYNYYEHIVDFGGFLNSVISKQIKK